ncbi:hypothetical protein HY250_02655 [Candidatus Azambacteria bacterium]|nr:hypothetical protein [Candidatus Azambacteria bacterium]MBI3685282.1 hypothetical protein [Candidatus Azambacteria bacterium]
MMRRKLRGKYNPTEKRRKYPNIQTALIDGARTRACAQCIRTTHKTKK